MPVRTTTNNGLRAAVSVTQMAKMVEMSRASFYAHVRQGHFLAPIYSTGNRRPIYTAEMQAKNLEVRATQMGVNGAYVLFYERQLRETTETPTRRPRAAGNAAGDLRRRLEGLGLAGLTDTQVEQALASSFPQGTAGVAEGDVLRVIYRNLRRSISA